MLHLKKIIYKFWLKKQNLPDDLKLAMTDFIESKDFTTVSPYWFKLSKKTLRKISDYGIENFKRTVGQHYFLLVKWKRFNEYFSKITEKVSNEKIEISQLIKQHDLFDTDASTSYNFYVLLLDKYIKNLTGTTDFSDLEEPQYGNPVTLEIENRIVSMDLLNSILDFNTLQENVNTESIQSVVEVGGGYGRDAFVFISKLPKVKRYVMVDIFPTLYIAQNYLQKVFPTKKIFTYRKFETFSEIEQEFNNSELVFLTPTQLDLLPEKSIDLILAIDCLHEMDKSTVNNYFDIFEKISSSLYYKCWQTTGSEFYQRHEYPKKDSWEEVFNRESTFPSKYFEAMYKF